MKMNLFWIAVVAWLVAFAPLGGVAQMSPGSGQMMREQGVTATPMEHALKPTPFYQEHTFLVLLGLAIGGAGFVVYRVARSRSSRRRTPAGFVSEAVLVVDLVDSTHLATHYGEGLAMRARNILKERALAVAEAWGLTFAENTGDGCLITFSSVTGAWQTAVTLLKDLKDQSPDLSPGPPLEVRAGISYGEILLDARGARHGATINKAFRLEGLPRESFAQVEGEGQVGEITVRNRIYVDEEAAHELRKSGYAGILLSFVGFARLKGFSGLHRVYEVPWQKL